MIHVKDAQGSANHNSRMPWILDRSLADAIEEWREQLKQQRAFEDLADRDELDRVLAEVGLGEGQLPLALRAHPRARLLCARMMRRVGIAALPAAAPDAADVERRCIRCVNKRHCEAWLAAAPEGERPPRFCANAEEFDRLRRR
ncbi:MAG: hypothetical protein JO128_23215 [Alphaproteobacteria bacterium]|nr:hypothetical protein [Alphaproteobacteria bacterium]